MDNQHKMISGYRDLSVEEIAQINAVKQLAQKVGEQVHAVGALRAADQRALAIAKTHLQTGLMWLVRAIARPEGF